MVVKIFAEVLRDLRTQRGFSQEKLAEIANVHDRHISFIERGLRKPSIVIVFKLAKALDIETSELIKMVEKRIKQSEEE